MNEMSIRDELRTYSKGDLTRIAVLATRKQAAAEAALKAADSRGRNFSFTTGVVLSACVTGSWRPLLLLVGWWGRAAWKAWRRRAKRGV